jgi:DNA-binding IclR family transcriptional regulator
VDRVGKIGVLSKIVAILDALAVADGRVSLSELSTRLGIPRPTLHRLINALREESLIDVQGGRFVAGLKLLEWSSIAMRSSDLRQVARPWLERLTAETGETSAIYVRVGHQCICLDHAQGPGLLRPVIRIGEPQPLHTGSAGRVIIAWSDPLEWETLWTLSEREFPTPVPVNPPDWWAIRRQGWVITTRERDDALASVSVPVLGAKGELVAAVSISGPLSRLPRERLKTFIPTLKNAAHAIGEALVEDAGSWDARVETNKEQTVQDSSDDARARVKRKHWHAVYPRTPP